MSRYGARRCEQCGDEYDPTGPRQKRCHSCRRKPKPRRPAVREVVTLTAECIGCGLEFSWERRGRQGPPRKRCDDCAAKRKGMPEPSPLLTRCGCGADYLTVALNHDCARPIVYSPS